MKFILLFFLSLNASAANVLFVGDSHSVGPFGWTFDQNLRDAGHSVATFASCGSVPGWWSTGRSTTCGFFSRDLNRQEARSGSSPTPLISELLKTYQPDVVVMEFGGNYLPSTDSTYITNDIRSFVSRVRASGAECFWITHPDTRNFRSEIPRVLALIKDAIKEDCQIFESHRVTSYPATGGDGTHYWSSQNTPQAISWAHKAFETFDQIWR